MSNKIKESNISDGAVTSNKIAPGTIAADRLAGSITNDQLAGSIANAKLANSSVTINGTSISLGGSGDITAGLDWQSVVTADGSTTTTATSGQGFFIDTSSAAHTINLPASPSLGDFVGIVDLGNATTNAITVGRNGSNIEGSAADDTMSTDKDVNLYVYSNATQGWVKYGKIEGPTFIQATGGTTTTSGDYKTHTFTSSGCFAVTGVSNTSSNNDVSYLVVAGGGGGGYNRGAGGGGGGFREGKVSTHPHTASPIASTGITVAASTYPITVGAGGTAAPTDATQRGGQGGSSIFSTITSAGGGGGGSRCRVQGGDGGSGGGGGSSGPAGGSSAAGAGNTPPVSPSQGNPGGTVGRGSALSGGSGGGGAGAPGSRQHDDNPATNKNRGDSINPTNGGVGADGGVGQTTSISGSSTGYSGGGGGGGSSCFPAGGNNYGGIGGYYPGGSPGGTTAGFGSNNGGSGIANGGAGTANTGGGAGGGAGQGGNGGAGGSGIVIIRYKFQ